MAASPSVDRRTFLRYVRQSGVLTDAQLADAQRRLPDSERGRIAARALVEMGLLTRFQAERILAGRTTGWVLDQYVILDHLGQGGMGRVYKARHRTMNRVVALKVLSGRVLRSELGPDLFLREVRAVAQLVHPNIVNAFDASQDGDRFYLVLEYVDGPNLEQLVSQQGPLPVGLACEYMRQAAVGLQCAHALGMVHRDIKPANILVQRKGAEGQHAPGLVKISDFGLARLADPGPGDLRGTIVTVPHAIMGTPDYVSPEQARNLHGTDIRSDIYSLGCTFYFLLTGQVPFPGGTAMEKLICHGTDAPEPVTRLRTDVPAEVAAVLDRMIAKEPDDRFQSPAEVATALEPYAVSGPTPWELRRPTSDPFIDPVATPALGHEAAERGTLANTGPDAALTPLEAFAGMESPPPLARAAEPRPMKEVLLWTAGAVAGALALIALLLVLALA